MNSDPTQPPRDASPWQFTLSDLFLTTTLAAGVAAVGAKLGAAGVGIQCVLSVLAALYWERRRPMFGFVVAITIYLAGFAFSLAMALARSG